MMNIADAQWFANPHLRDLFDILGTDNLRCVGGCVRDTLLGVHGKDTEIDLATRHVPDEVETRLAKANIKTVPVGKAHGTILAVFEGAVFEITSLREDIEADGRHAKVKFGTDWAQDARRRDFTINALYADAQGQVYDPLGQGVADLQNGTVRFIGDAAERICEDVLRILRFFRFHYRFAPAQMAERHSFDACKHAAPLIADLSGERICQEMFKILAPINVKESAPQALIAMQESDILPHILPHFDIARMQTLIEFYPQSDARLRLAALLRAEDVAAVKARWQLSNRDTRRLEAALYEHELAYNMLPQAMHKALYQFGLQAFSDQLCLAAAGSQKQHWRDWHHLWAAAKAWDIPEFELTGAMLRGAGIEEGVQMGEMQKQVEALWIKSGFARAPSDIMDELLQGS